MKIMPKKISYIFVMVCLILATSCAKKQATTNMQPRSTLSDIDMGDRYSKAPKKHRKKHKHKVATARNEFVEERKREMKKKEKDAAKPQYTNPAYFGHKKKPKKRKRGKRKFCKECGIVH